MFLIFLIATGLSMDTFSLSLAYGMFSMSNRDKFFLSFLVGLFHFFMPLLGFIIGSVILNFIKIDPDILVFIILFIIGVDMIISSFKKEEVKGFSLFYYFLFALAVSIDSFSVGITLNEISSILIGPIVFAIISFIFTLFGLFMGGKIKRFFGQISTVIGGLVLIILGIIFLF